MFLDCYKTSFILLQKVSNMFLKYFKIFCINKNIMYIMTLYEKFIIQNKYKQKYFCNIIKFVY